MLASKVRIPLKSTDVLVIKIALRPLGKKSELVLVYN